MIERGEDQAFARRSLTNKTLRQLELRARMPSHRGRNGTCGASNLKEVRRREREPAQRPSTHTASSFQTGTPRAPNPKVGVSAANGTRLETPLRGKLRGTRRSQKLRSARGHHTGGNCLERQRPYRSLEHTQTS